jgi:ribose/xylose/arabinose/galactoside ABC-type transport system permease subunit
MSAAATPGSTSGTPNLIVRAFLSEYLVLILAGAYFLALLPFTPSLADRGNLANLLATLLPLFVVALGQTVVLITGGIDLSVTSIMALTSVAGALTMNGENGWLAGSAWATPLGILLMLLVGAAVGLLNGAAVTGFRMPPFIVTLTSMMFFSGLAIWLTKSRTIYGLPANFNALGSRTVLAFLITTLVALALHIMLSRSLWGRWLYALGHNARTARVSGVPVAGVTTSAYVVSGLTAAVAAVLYTGQAETGSPVLGQRLLLDIIAATVIGGTSLFGGRGRVLGTLWGVIFIKLIDNSLNLLSLSLFAITLVKGGVILLAAWLDAVRHRLLTSGS